VRLYISQGKGNKNLEFWAAIKAVEFVSVRMSRRILRERDSGMINLNVHYTTEDRTDYALTEQSFYQRTN
jgi:hypothetical protein